LKCRLVTDADGKNNLRRPAPEIQHPCGFLAFLHRNSSLEKLAEGADRIGLDGHAAGTVSASEAADALVKLKAAKARVRKITPTGKALLATPAAKPPSPAPRRLGLADLRRAAQQRKAALPSAK
jgi:sRNA-binding protein